MSFAVISSGDECGKACIDHHLTEPGIHLFTASWCVHCKRMLKEHEAHKASMPGKYSRRFDNVTNVNVVKHDREEFTKDELDEMIKNRDIDGYPTIYFVRDDGKKMKYEDRRELSKLNEAYEKFNS